jgi:hypothetical protein
MSVLSQAAGVAFLRDSLLFLPDDPELGKFRKKFKNTLVLMEDRDPEGVIESNEDEDQKDINTEKMVYDLAKNNENKVNQLAVLRVRLLDNFIMDFDRHEGQWKWIGIDSGKGKLYYPVPKDRDQVFYTNQGLLPEIAKSKSLFPELQGFRAKTKNVRTFNRAARNFDHFFLTELTKEQWSKQIDEFLHSMSDSVIEAALNKQPKEIQKYSAPKIIHLLELKRRYFKEDMMKYYRFLSRTVAVVGSNQQEQFTVTKFKDGNILVVVNKLDSLGNLSTKMYERLFNHHVTKEIQLYGLEGDDKFVIQGGKSQIKVRLVGGPGNDQFINNGSRGKNLAYDVSFENNTVTGEGLKNRITNDPLNNEYRRLGYNYSFISPSIALEYSTDGGFFLGPKVKITAQGFRKDPYNSYHVISADRAINSSSYHIKYDGVFIKAFGKTDILINADLKLPTSRTNFFGYGNNTVFDKTKPGGIDYYHAKYDLADVVVLARTPFNSWLNIRYGPVFQFFRLRGHENEDQYLVTLPPGVIDAKTAYQGKYFVGGELDLAINTKNNLALPTRGIVLNGYVRSLYGIIQTSNNVTQVGGNFAFYTDFISKRKVVLASTFGVGHNIGRFDFEQSQYLGFKENLRAFRIQRFAGRTRAYNNTELRIKIADINTYLFPAGFGILGFNDIGRVWADSEKSDVWHDGYGGGIWLAPLNKFVVTASLTYSNEERHLGLLTFGYQF